MTDTLKKTTSSFIHIAAQKLSNEDIEDTIKRFEASNLTDEYKAFCLDLWHKELEAKDA